MSKAFYFGTVTRQKSLKSLEKFPTGIFLRNLVCCSRAMLYTSNTHHPYAVSSPGTALAHAEWSMLLYNFYFDAYHATHPDWYFINYVYGSAAIAYKNAHYAAIRNFDFAQFRPNYLNLFITYINLPFFKNRGKGWRSGYFLKK